MITLLQFVIGCSASKQRVQGTIAQLEDIYPNECEVHNILLQLDTIPILYGYRAICDFDTQIHNYLRLPMTLNTYTRLRGRRIIFCLIITGCAASCSFLRMTNANTSCETLSGIYYNDSNTKKLMLSPKMLVSSTLDQVVRTYQYYELQDNGWIKRKQGKWEISRATDGDESEPPIIELHMWGAHLGSGITCGGCSPPDTTNALWVSRYGRYGIKLDGGTYDTFIRTDPE